MTASKVTTMPAAGEVPAAPMSCAAVSTAMGVGNGRQQRTTRSQGQYGRAHDEDMSYAMSHLNSLKELRCMENG
jgi:hypothetical protein